MRRSPHGYTNQTVRDGVVVKTHAGPDAPARLDREYRALQLVRDHVPVPPVLDRAPHTLTLGFVEGRHGQDLITAGHAEPVLAACGSVLHDIYRAGVGHGDFGPQNLLLIIWPGTLL
jgi:RIO-like serine/threonine protein kinase